MKYILLLAFMIHPVIGLSTGGIIAGLLPAPKILKGKIKDGIYIAPKKEFKISVPNWNNKSEYQYMKVKERFSKTGEYLSFGPAAFNQNIYRLEYSRKLSFEGYYIELNTIKALVFKKYIKQIEKAYHAKIELISEDVDLFDARKSYSRIYRQHIPAKKKLFKKIAETLRYHFIDLVDYGSYNLMFWVEVDVNLENRSKFEEKLKIRDYEPYQRFVHSFDYLKEPSKSFRGKIKDGIYYSENNKFSVKVPHLPSQSQADKQQWQDTIVHDDETKEIDYVVFGPSKKDYNLYHAVLLHFPFEKDKEKYVKWLLEQKLIGRSLGLTQKHFEKFQFKGLDRYYAVYESENDFFVNCITDNGENFYEIEVDIAKNTKFPKINLEQLINREFTLFNEMLDSFTILH